MVYGCSSNSGWAITMNMDRTCSCLEGRKRDEGTRGGTLSGEGSRRGAAQGLRLAEQTGEEDARWIVDPLDGTTNYAHGLPIFCFSLALERVGEVILGVVYDPIREEAYVAERGGGATLNGEPIRVSDTDELIQALIATGFPYDRPKMPEALELFGRFAAITRGMRRLGSTALDLCYVAAGRLDGYYERGIWAWDIAAGALILEEAGGKVTDYQGGMLDLEDRQIVASNGTLNAAMTKLTGEDVRGCRSYRFIPPQFPP